MNTDNKVKYKQIKTRQRGEIMFYFILAIILFLIFLVGVIYGIRKNLLYPISVSVPFIVLFAFGLLCFL